MKKTERRYMVQQCEQRWFTLNKIEGTSDIRFCAQCTKTVHWCKTEDDIKEAIRHKRCVAAENSLVYTDKPEVKESDDSSESHRLSRLCVGSVEPTYLVEVTDVTTDEPDFEL